MPAGVPGGTDTIPVEGASTGTGPPPIEAAGVMTAPVIVAGVAGTPFNKSLV